MADKFPIVGLGPLLSKLETIKYETRYKGGRFALRKAAQLVRNAATQNAIALDDPETGRNIAANIKERWNGKRYKQTGDLGFRVGVQYGAVSPPAGTPRDESAGAPTPHWRFVEFGTETQPAQPFMRPALENNVGVATDEFVRQYDKALTRAIRKAAK